MTEWLRRHLRIVVPILFAGLAIAGSMYVADKKVPPNTLQTQPSPAAGISGSAAEQFILMGDIGTASSEESQVADSLQKKCDTDGNCQGIFILGDIIYETGISSATDPQLQTKLEKPYAKINTPFYLVLGNHDYGGCTNCYTEFAQSHHKWHFPHRYYAQSFASVSFFVIDTENFDSHQQLWLTRSLAESQKPWNIVLGHRPIVSQETSKENEYWKGIESLREIVCNGADLYVSGHAHLLEERKQEPGCSAKFLISGSGGSTVRKIIQPFTGAFYAEENGFLSLTIEGERLSYSFINKSGELLHTASVTSK